MRRTLLALPLALALHTLAATQSTWYVDVTAVPPGAGTLAEPYASIDYALAQPATLSGDLVLVAPGTYAENVVFPGKGVRVVSTDGPATTRIDAGGSGSAVAFLGNDGTIAILDGFTVTGGAGTSGTVIEGGGIYGRDALICIVDCIVEQNDAERGGGMYVENCVTEVLHSQFRENCTAAAFFPNGGGGAYLQGGQTWLLASLFENNTAGTPIAPQRGGGVFSAGTLLARRTIFRDNVAEGGGGGLYGAGRLERCRLTGNLAQFGGGAQENGTLEIYDSIVDDNRADSTSGTANFGGGVYGTALLVRTVLQDNLAFGSGGGADGGATLVDCVVDGNRAVGGFDGVGVVAGGVDNCTLTDCVVSNNTAVGDGSFWVARGGGAGNSTLDGCAVFDNSALGPNSSGGGLSESTARFTTVYDNYTDGSGGGARAGWTERCTLVGNSAGVSADGVWVPDFTNGTVLDSIVWNNGEEILVGTFGTASVTYTDVQGGFAGTGNIDDDPDFWDEAGRDFHLQASSPCIDAGNPASPLDPDGTRADMGAFYYDPTYTGGADEEGAAAPRQRTRD